MSKIDQAKQAVAFFKDIPQEEVDQMIDDFFLDVEGVDLGGPEQINVAVTVQLKDEVIYLGS